MGTGTGTPVIVGTAANVTDLAAPVAGRNLLPLDVWREIMGYNPWHFWQLANSKVPVTSACNTIVNEWAWQAANQAGRAEIRQAIAYAEQKLTAHLGFSPIPKWGSYTTQWPRHHDQRLTRWARAGDARWQRISVQLDTGYVLGLGVETTIAIATGAVVVYSDVDGDGLNETATISVATSVTDPRQIAVYFASADRVGALEDNRIQPARVVIAGGTATITISAWLLVKPALYRGANAGVIDPDTAGSLASTVDVYRKYTASDGTATDNSQAVLIWDTLPGCYDCASAPANSTDPASVAQVAARAGVRDAALGIVLPAEAIYDPASGAWAESSTWYREPDRVTVRYHAGYPLMANGLVSREWAEIIAILAAAELSERICACDNANRALHRWQFDTALAGNSEEQYRVSPEDLNNPFGARRGHIESWRRARQWAIARGVSV